jgi:hypothetical protein
MPSPIVDRLIDVADRLAAATRHASPEPPAAGEWTPADIVRHLIAVELEVWHPRLDQLATEDHPTWAWVEPDRWTDEPDADIERLVEVFRVARLATIDRLAEIDWGRTGTHATFGVLDVPGLMTKAVDHDEEHLASLGG